MNNSPITQQRTKRPSKTIAALLCGVALTLSACATSPQSDKDNAGGGGVEEMEKDTNGPHAADDRPREALDLRVEGGLVHANLDIGNTTVGDYSAPVRGTVVAPDDLDAPAPLVVINHLRFPACDERQFAYPCPKDSAELRLDRGMTYLGEALARQGYAVLIPDLAPAWVGSDIKDPYDQDTMWTQTVESLVGALTGKASAPKELAQHLPPQNIDLDNVGLVLHSRSGTLAGPAVQLFGRDHVKGVLAYGPAYDTFDAQHFSPQAPDVPYFAISGDMDEDVKASANEWLGRYVAEQRTTPAMVANVEGFGHMLVNRAVDGPEFDDRIGCAAGGGDGAGGDGAAVGGDADGDGAGDGDGGAEDAAGDGAGDGMEQQCPTAEDHRELLAQAATHWFEWAFSSHTDSSPQSQDTHGAPDSAALAEQWGLPVGAESPIPDTLAGHPARWLVASPGNKGTVTRVGAKDIDGDVTHCVPSDPMSPEHPDDACPEVPEGVVSMSFATDVALGTQAVAAVDGVQADTLAVHLSPWGTAAGSEGAGANRTGSGSSAGTGSSDNTVGDNTAGSSDSAGKDMPLAVTAVFADGSRHTVNVDPTSAALRNRKDQYSNGNYMASTVRVQVPQHLRNKKIQKVELQTHAGRQMAVLGVDLIGH